MECHRGFERCSCIRWPHTGIESLLIWKFYKYGMVCLFYSRYLHVYLWNINKLVYINLQYTPEWDPKWTSFVLIGTFFGGLWLWVLDVKKKMLQTGSHKLFTFNWNRCVSNLGPSQGSLNGTWLISRWESKSCLMHMLLVTSEGSLFKEVVALFGVLS